MRRPPSLPRLSAIALLAAGAWSFSDCATSGSTVELPARFACGDTTCDRATEYCQKPRGPGICPMGDTGGCIPGCAGCPSLPPPSCAKIPASCVGTPTCACIGPAACGITPAMCTEESGGPLVDCLSS